MTDEFLQTALGALWQSLVEFLPLLLSGLLVLLVGWILAKILAFLVRRLLRRLNVDTMVERTGLAQGLAQAQVTRPVSELIALLVFWLVFLSFLLVALDNLGLSIALVPLQGLIGYLPHVLAVILILVVGAFLAQLLGRTTQAAMASLGVEFHQGLGQVVRGLLLLIAVILAIEQLGFNIELLTDTLTNLLTIIAAGLALAFALGGREVARNVLAGYYARETFELGDIVTLEGVEGTLEAIGPLNAELDLGGDRFVIPNSSLTEGQVRIRGHGADSDS